MKIKEYLSTLESLSEKMGDDTSNSVTFTILAELAKQLDASVENGCAPIDALECYLYLAADYYETGHYLFALEYYNKAMKAFKQCGTIVINIEDDLHETLEEGFVKMFDIYKKMDMKKEKRKLMPIIKKFMPSLLAALKKVKKIGLIHDPIEFTEAYIKILPELETKIEAELKGVKKGHGYCFEYWHKKKEILKRDYGIGWDSPGVLNPHVRFD